MRPMVRPARKHMSRRVRLESMNALLVADEGHDRREVVIREPWDRRHVAVRPVVLTHAVSRRKDECSVSVVIRFVHNRQVGWAQSGPTQVRAVTLSTTRLIQRSPCSYEVSGCLSSERCLSALTATRTGR